MTEYEERVRRKWMTIGIFIGFSIGTVFMVAVTAVVSAVVK
jgi:hypothetical protein